MIDKIKKWLDKPHLTKKGKAYTNKYYLRNELIWAGMFLMFCAMFCVLFLGVSDMDKKSKSLALCQALVPRGYHYIDYNSSAHTCDYGNDVDFMRGKYVFDPVRIQYVLVKP